MAQCLNGQYLERTWYYEGYFAKYTCQDMYTREPSAGGRCFSEAPRTSRKWNIMTLSSKCQKKCCFLFVCQFSEECGFILVWKISVYYAYSARIKSSYLFITYFILEKIWWLIRPNTGLERFLSKWVFEHI